MKINRYLDPEQGGGAGGNEIPVEQQEEANKFQGYLSKGIDTLTEEEKKEFEVLKGKFDYEELDEEGKPLTEEKKKAIKETQDRIKTIEAKAEKDRTLEEKKFLEDNIVKEEVDVYEQVNELTGFDPSELDYQGVDPKSAEGIAKRETYIKEKAQKEFDQDIKERYPRAYQFLLHTQKGGKEEDFFKPENSDFLNVKLSQKDVVSQERFYRQALAIKGNKPEHIDAIVQLAKDSNKLYEESKAELEALQASQEEKQKRNEQLAKQAEQAQLEAENQFVNSLTKQIEKGLNNNPLPIHERRKLFDFIASNTLYQNGKFLLVRELDVNKLDSELATEYFRFKGGKLDDLVTTKAKTLNANKYKSGVQFKVKVKGSQETRQGFTPLSRLVK